MQKARMVVDRRCAMVDPYSGGSSAVWESARPHSFVALRCAPPRL